MKLYLVNEYVGGTPFESSTLGVYLSLDLAKEHLNKELRKHDHEDYFDIDNEEDFRLSETIAQFIPFEDRYKAFYYEPSYTDYVVPNVMKDDGVDGTSLGKENQTVTNVPELMNSMSSDKSWYKTLINTENNSCTVVNQMPGEGNRRHFHAKWNEWWYILRGKWLFQIGDESHEVVSGDLVFIEKGNKHCITALGDSIASRLAVSRYDVEHIYKESPSN